MATTRELMSTTIELRHRLQTLESRHRLARQALDAMPQAVLRVTDISIEPLAIIHGHLQSLEAILAGEVLPCQK